LPQILLDPDAEEVYDVPGTPFALVLDRWGVVRAKGTVNNLEQVEGLVDTAASRMAEDEERWAS
jgi:predicted aspartyl protease